MLRQVGPLGSAKVALHLLRHLWVDFLLAAVLCGISAPLNPSLAQGLAPEVLLPIWGIAVSVFTGFRHGQAYERWWEARKLWGALLNQSRQWRDALEVLVDGDCKRLLEQQVQLVWAINAELRGQVSGCGADQLLREQAQAIAQLHHSRAIDPWGRLQLMEIHAAICDAFGGLERIRNHPMPAPYDVFVRVAVWSFGYLLFLHMDALYAPWGAWVALVVMLLFISVERFGAFVEAPFSPHDLALPMDRICSAITCLLLTDAHPLAQPPQSEQALVWT